MERLAFELGGDDQPMRKRTGLEAPLDLGIGVAPGTFGAIGRIVSQEVAVRRAEKGAPDLAAPVRRFVSVFCPEMASSEPIAAAVERVGVSEGEGIETVELGSAAQGNRRNAKLDRRSRLPGSAQPRRKIAVAVLVPLAVEAVDSGSPLPSDGSGKRGFFGDECTGSRRTQEAERAALRRCAKARPVRDSVDGDDATDR